MSKTITAANLAANADKTYAIDDFRSMVNYVNPKNKGYVRFAMGPDGKLSAWSASSSRTSPRTRPSTSRRRMPSAPSAWSTTRSAAS